VVRQPNPLRRNRSLVASTLFRSDRTLKVTNLSCGSMQPSLNYSGHLLLLYFSLLFCESDDGWQTAWSWRMSGEASAARLLVSVWRVSV